MHPDSAALADSALLRADQAARDAAVDTTRSFLLQAPAGSGKTTVLGCRLLALLATVAEPEEVLAITFTRKAAAEMREQVLQALQAAVTGAAGHEHETQHAAAAWRQNLQRGWNLLAAPARLRVMTIDAFCQTLCAQLPVATRNGLRLQVAARARPLYAAAARRALGRALEDAALVEPAQLLFARLDNDWSRFEELLILMLAERAHWLPRVLATGEIGAERLLEARVASSLSSLIAGRLGAALACLPGA
jgi:ATP-dependent helicase/nuclease subunit A